jgi:hypothetical protein
MSDEQRASLEARTRAELAMNRLTDGELHVHCVRPLVVVEYKTPGLPIRSNSAALATDINQWVEEILALIHAVTTPASEIANQTNTLQAPRIEPPPSEIAARLPPQPNTASAVPVPNGPEASTRGQTSYMTDLGIGLCSELWAKPMNALLGPCATLGLRLSSLSRIAVIGGTQWSLARPADINIRHWQAGIEARLGASIWFALGAQVSILHLTPGNGLLPNSQIAYEPMLTMRGGYTVPLTAQRLATSAGLRSYPEYRDVRVNGQRAFRLPILAFTLGVEYEFDL